MGETKRGSIRKITYSDGKVKIQNPIHMTQMQEKLYKAGVIDEYGNAKFSKDDTIYDVYDDGDFGFGKEIGDDGTYRSADFSTLIEGLTTVCKRYLEQSGKYERGFMQDASQQVRWILRDKTLMLPYNSAPVL